MAIKYQGIDARPNFTALSSDVNLSASRILADAIIGATVYLLDTKGWYIISGSGSGSAAEFLPYVDPKLAT